MVADTREGNDVVKDKITKTSKKKEAVEDNGGEE